MIIDLELRKQPPSSYLYALSYNKLVVLKEYLDEILKSGKIQLSKSSAGAPIFIVSKPHDRGLHIVINYHSLNAITIKDKYPLLLMTDLIN